MRNKLIVNILYEFAGLASFFLLVFYCLDNLYPGYVRYHFDLGYIMILVMLALGIGIIIDDEEDAAPLKVTPKTPTLITLFVAVVVGVMFGLWRDLGIINQVAGFIAFL